MKTYTIHDSDGAATVSLPEPIVYAEDYTPYTHIGFHTLKEVENMTGIKADNLRQRLRRGTIKGIKVGRDWLVSSEQVGLLREGKNASKSTNN